MADRWTLRTPTGDLQLNETFAAPTYQPGGTDTNALTRRESRSAFQRTGDGLATPGPLRLVGRVLRDDRDARAMLNELTSIRDAVRACTSVRRTNAGGTYTYPDLAGGPPPAITPDGRGGWNVTIELWPGRAEPTHLPPIAVVPDGVWLESLNIQQADGTPVATWLDSSDAQYHMSSIDPVTPILRHDQTPTGAPALETTAVNARLRGPRRWFLDPSEHFTLFIVAATSNTEGLGAVLVSNIERDLSGLPPNGFYLRWPMVPPNWSARFTKSNGASVDFADQTNDGDFHVLCLTQGEPSVSGGLGFRAFVDGEPDTNSPAFSAGGHAPDVPLALFGHPITTTDKGFRGLTAAVLWFREELSDLNRDRIHDYLRNRYIGG